MVKGVIFDLYNTLIYISQKRRPYLHLFRDLKVDFSKATKIAMTEDLSSLEELAQRLSPNSIDLSRYQKGLDEELSSICLYSFRHPKIPTYDITH